MIRFLLCLVMVSATLVALTLIFSHFNVTITVTPVQPPVTHTTVNAVIPPPPHP